MVLTIITAVATFATINTLVIKAETPKETGECNQELKALYNKYSARALEGA